MSQSDMIQDELRLSTLRGYLRDFYVKPDMSKALWELAGSCLNNTKQFFYAVKFSSDLMMRQFALAVLLSSGKQFNWDCFKSFSVVQNYLDGSRLLTDYSNLDICFILHEEGTMYNKILGQSINQLAVMRKPKKTFLFDMGGYKLPDLISPVTGVQGLLDTPKISKDYGDNL